ncbi:MAG: hypothetical protein NTU98_14850 [Bacteroidetes bacterium]|nr:hypothetical protein [Bacteroidota bacterium]
MATNFLQLTWINKRILLVLLFISALFVQNAKATSFATGSLIIPMDATYQDLGMWKAYGLVYNLLSNGVPVHWAINSSKTWNGTDFTATTNDLRLGGSSSSHDYSGGPFIIDVAYAAQATTLINAWWSKTGNLPNVRAATAPAGFTATVNIILKSAPRIANESINAGVTIAYYNAAGIPDLNGNQWTTSSPNILTETMIANGALSTNGNCSVRYFDIFVTPHNGGYSYSLTDPTNLGTRTYAALDFFVQKGGGWMALCHSVLSNENAIVDLYKNSSPSVRALFTSSLNGGFLTDNGFSTISNASGTWTVNEPTLPLAQAIITTGATQGLPGGAVQNWPRSTVSYYSQTEKVASFINGGTIYDWGINGVSHGGTGLGKMTFLGGHSYSVSLPYSTNMEAPYLRFFYNALFFNGSAVAKLELTSTPLAIPNNATSHITLNLANTGSSIATGTHDVTINLAVGVTYIGMLVGSAPTVTGGPGVGTTLSWGIALGDIAAGTTPLQIDVTMTPTSQGDLQFANLTAAYGDVFGEGFAANLCRTITVTALPSPSIAKTPPTQTREPGQVATWTLTYQNTGALALLNSKVEDLLPASFTYKSATPAPSSVTNSGGQTLLRWYTGTLAPSSSAAITLNVYAGGTVGNTYTNNATLTGNDQYSNSYTYTANATATVLISPPPITLTKTVDPTGSAAAGTLLTYTLRPFFSSSDLLSDVMIADPVPAYATYNPGTVSAGGTYGFVQLDKVDGYDPDAGTGNTTCSVWVPTNATRVVGDTVTVNVKLINNSGKTIIDIVPTLSERDNDATISIPSPTSVASLASGSSTTFVYHNVIMTEPGAEVFIGSADGTIQTSPAEPYSFADGNSNSMLVTSFLNASPVNDVTAWRLGSNTAADPGQTIISGTSPFIYALCGNTKNLFSANTIGNGWNSKLVIPTNVKAGGALTIDNAGMIYATAGNGTKKFYKYDVVNNTWTALADATDNIKDGGALQFLNVGGTNYVFALIGNNGPGSTGTKFSRYTIGGGWTARAVTPEKISGGGALTTNGTYLYALQGNNNNGFYRYDPVADSWTSLANTLANVNWGGALTRIGNYIYALEGNNTAKFWRYDITAGTWSDAVTDAPGTVSNGGALTNDGTNVYAFKGKGKVYWRYNVGTNNWTVLTSVNFTSNVDKGGALVYYPGNSAVGYYSDMLSSQTLVTTGDQVTITLTLSSDNAVTNVSPTSVTVTGINSATATKVSGPTLMSSDDDISGISDPVVYQWVYSTTAGSLPGSAVTFTAGGTGTHSGAGVTFPPAISQSVLIAPVLSYQANIFNSASLPPSVSQITNFAMISDNQVLDEAVESNRTNTPIDRPQLSLIKSNSPTGTITPGQVITYTLVVHNEGPGSAVNVVVTDAIPGNTTYVTGSASPVPFSGPSPLVFHLGTIAASASATITFKVTGNSGLGAGDYTIDNSYTVTSDAFTGSLTSNTVTNTLHVAKSFVVIKTADVDAISAAGNIINYRISVINTGNVALSTIHISDPMFASLSGPEGDYSPTGTLDVGETWIYTGSYTVPQSVIDNNGGGDGKIDNTVSVYFDNLTSPQTASAFVYIIVLEVTKTPTPSVIAIPGDISYAYTVKNNGGASLHTLTLTDDKIGSITLGATTLAAGASTTGTGTYHVDQAKIDAGTPITNIATAAAKFTPSSGPDINVSATATATVTITHEPFMTVTKTQTSALNPVTNSGQVITYSVVVTNAGNTSITGVNATETYPGTGTGNLSGPTESGTVDNILNVGEHWTYTATYTTTTDDICAGVALKNTINVTSTQVPGPKTAFTTTGVTLPSTPAANFTADSLFPQRNTTVTLTNSSSNTTSWNWSFDRITLNYVNATSSTSQNPQVQFTEGGPYTVTLVAHNLCFTDTKVRTAYIWAGRPGLWYGKYDSDWKNYQNWDNWRIPESTYFIDVFIHNTADHWPDYTYGDLTVGTGGDCSTLTISPSGQLTVSGGKLIINP